MLKKNIQQICIIGMPGSGKSAVGKILSEKLNYNYFDTDARIEKITNSKIKEIFEIEGEEKFRKLETKVLKELISYKKIVISTGGGVILHNKRILEKSYNIYLQCKLDILIKRVSRNENRPLLVENISENMKNLFNKRKIFYDNVSDLKIDASNNLQKTVAQIIDNLPL